ncbi:hypothetical protein [Novosphingobium fuchskuhlense]|uniref:MmyB family transcriptional regulator n=1 Tax=Novosphingobium fuchskuhlense TaxID=1117702 RepID=UPI0014700FD7
MFDGEDQPNLLRYNFNSAQARSLRPDWETRSQQVLAEFRRDYGRVLGDPCVAGAVAWAAPDQSCFPCRMGQAEQVGPRGWPAVVPAPAGLHAAFPQHALAEVECGVFRLVVLEPVR